MTAWTAESLPPELVALHDQPGGTSLRGLAGILNAYDRWREDGERDYPPDTGKLCCCDTGMDCPACMTGRCFECPDNPEREQEDDDARDDWDYDDEDDDD